MFFTLLGSSDYGSLDIDPIENVQFLAEHETTMHVWNLIIFVVFGLVLVALTLGLFHMLRSTSPLLAQAGAALGLIWAGLVIASGMVANVGAQVVIDLYQQDAERAASTWLALHFVVDGLGGGNEIVGGAWVLLVSFAARQGAVLPAALNFAGMAVGAAGCLTLIPGASEPMGAVFGLGLIVWFVWAAVAILRSSDPEPHSRPIAAPSLAR